jgi:hypothetical protein
MAARGGQPFTLEEFAEDFERVWHDIDTWQPEGWP